MIRIELDLAVAIYLTLGLLILVAWVIVEGGRKLVKHSSERDSLWQCPLCFFVYIDSCSEGMSRCPRCSTLHKRSENVVQ